MSRRKAYQRKETNMDRAQLEDIIAIIEQAGNPLFTQSPDFHNCKHKMLSGEYDSVTKKEYKEFVGALKTAESKLNSQGGPLGKEFAFVLRRLLYHADELGFPEFAQLKKRFKWSFF